MSQAERNRLKAYLIDVIGYEPAVGPLSYTPAQSRAMMLPMTMAALAETGVSPAEMGAGPSEETKCRVTMSLIRQMVALPPEQAGPFLRGFRSM
jgi:hypothetical protein